MEQSRDMNRVVYLYIAHFDRLNVTRQAQCDIRKAFQTASFKASLLS